MKTQVTKTQTKSGLWLALFALMLACVAARAETVICSENFDDGNGDDRWFADQGLWQMGSPTVGPPTNAAGGRAFSGTNCATTRLTGNYLDNQDSRLTRIASFIVPAANQNPRLRFWHWYSIGGGDHATVEIRPLGSNTWTTVSSDYGDVGNLNYIPNGGGVWTRPSLDLSQFAGRTVQIAFHFHSDGGSAIAPNGGWFVDDVALVTGTPVVNNPEGFEGGLGDWSTERGTWQVGMPTSGPGAAYAGTNCAATVLTNNYPAFADTRLVSVPLTLPSRSSSPALRFRQWFRFVAGDQGVVEIKATRTNTWTPLATYSGINGGWTYPFLDLSSYGGQTVQIAFHFTSDGGSQDVGWYIDDVRILHDFALLLLDSPTVRTQNTACVPLGIAASSPASNVSFTLQAPSGHLGNLTLNTEGCWTGSIMPQPDSQWLVTLQNNCLTAAMGVQTVGSVCFTAVSTESAIVPLSPNNLVVANLDGSTPPALPFGNRNVIIADKPLLEAWLGPNRQRMVTTYGKANTAYEISQATDVIASHPWTPGWTNTVPASLSYSSPVQGSLSNAPILYLRANER